MRVVGLDLSLTATGIAWPSMPDADDVVHETIRSRASGPTRLVEIRDQVVTRCHAQGLFTSLVVVEGYNLGVARRGSALADLGELGGVVRVAFHEAGVRYVDVPPSSLKKYATGKGNATKDQVLSAAVHRSGIEFPDNNQADAWWLRQMGCAHLGLAHVQMPAVNREALDKIDWPELQAVNA